MKIGDKMRFPLRIEGTTYGPHPATVVHIHPEGRHYTVRFDLPRGSFRETFPLPPRCGSDD